MAMEDDEISGLALLRQPATAALASYLNDLLAALGFQAYLALTIVKADYARRDPSTFPRTGEPAPPESAVAQMDIHRGVLNEMLFCRAINSYLTYLADLMTLIYEKYPRKLPTNKQMTYGFGIEHHLAGDLISALAEETVFEKTHQGFEELAKYFKKNLDLILFTKEEDRVNAALCVDIRNIVTHNRGIINRFFIQRNPTFADAIGKRFQLTDDDLRNKLGDLGYCARQLDIRASKKFGLATIEPTPEDGDQTAPE
jgi:hypothetical protein